jgi:KDO2-lipid IV(A) lauroyltransferase
MYYIIYPLFYLLSLLPWRVLYILSDAVYGLLYYIIGYRKKVVMYNLGIAFPEKTEAERIRIAKQFYRKFTDTFIETIKLLSVSDKTFSKRFTTNIEEINKRFADSDRSIQFVAGHFFNWEFANLGLAKHSALPFVAVYMPVANKALDKIIYRLRARYGTILIPATEFKTRFREYVNERYGLALVADQNPGTDIAAWWIPFFGKLTPFVTGPEKGAKRNNTATVFVHFYSVKRGYYHAELEVIADDPKQYTDGKLTELFVQHLEKAIRKEPANYLWSHRRWKWNYDENKHGRLRVR